EVAEPEDSAAQPETAEAEAPEDAGEARASDEVETSDEVENAPVDDATAETDAEAANEAGEDLTDGEADESKAWRRLPAERLPASMPFPMSAQVDRDSLLLIGRVWQAHGIRGEVKVVLETDDPNRFADLTTVFTGTNADAAERSSVESFRFQPTKSGTLVLFRLGFISTREEADAQRKQLVFARLDDLPPLVDGEYFLHDLVGLTVDTEYGQTVGIVDD